LIRKEIINILPFIIVGLVFLYIILGLKRNKASWHIIYVTMDGKSRKEFDFKLLRNSCQKVTSCGISFFAMENLIIYLRIHEWISGPSADISAIIITLINTFLFMAEDLREFVRDMSMRPHIYKTEKD